MGCRLTRPYSGLLMQLHLRMCMLVVSSDAAVEGCTLQMILDSLQIAVQGLTGAVLRERSRFKATRSRAHWTSSLAGVWACGLTALL